MNNLREIKKSRLLHDESFTYMISSNERTNNDPNVALTNFYDFNFGGFNEPYEEYQVQVLSFSCTGGIPVATGYYIFVVENLDTDGYFCKKMLTNRQVILTKLPLNAISDAFIQSDKGSTGFKIKNARNVRNVKFSFLTSSFGVPAVGTINHQGETQWILSLKMTPIVNDY
jgi:hypothetical protein